MSSATCRGWNRFHQEHPGVVIGPAEFNAGWDARIPLGGERRGLLRAEAASRASSTRSRRNWTTGRKRRTPASAHERAAVTATARPPPGERGQEVPGRDSPPHLNGAAPARFPPRSHTPGWRGPPARLRWRRAYPLIRPRWGHRPPPPAVNPPVPGFFFFFFFFFFLDKNRTNEGGRPPQWNLPEQDDSKRAPRAPRVYNFLTGGHDNYVPDRSSPRSCKRSPRRCGTWPG